MGLDLGTKTVGIALSDETGMTAQPLLTWKRVSRRRDIEELLSIISANSVESIVIGMPINLDGTESKRAKETAKFAAKLKQKTALPIMFWDERMSTVAVTRVLLLGGVSRSKRKAVVDKMAAAYILQGYLDSPRSCPETCISD